MWGVGCGDILMETGKGGMSERVVWEGYKSGVLKQKIKKKESKLLLELPSHCLDN